jgi:hypothetical protein
MKAAEKIMGVPESDKFNLNDIKEVRDRYESAVLKSQCARG